MSLKNYEFWFVVGSQFLYGPEVLETVAARAQEMVDELREEMADENNIAHKVQLKFKIRAINLLIAERISRQKRQSLHSGCQSK